MSPVQQQPLVLRTGKGTSLPRITMEFSLSGVRAQHDLLHEFSLHHEVVAVAADRDGAPGIQVETIDSAAALWEVRATIGMFDDRAVELKDQG